MLNSVELIGNLGRDPEVRQTNNGTQVANLSIATTEKWKDKNTGEKREATEWHKVTLWGALAGIAGQYLRKGSKCYVRGKLQTRKWQDQQGQDRYTTEVVCQGFDGKMVMLDPPPQQGYQQQPQGGYQQQPQQQQQAPQQQQWGGQQPQGYQQPPMQQGQGQPPQQMPGGGVGSDLDDAVPF